MGKHQHTDPAADPKELEAGVPWLDEEHFTLIEDDADSDRTAARVRRYDQTQRIWIPADVN